MAQLYRNLEKYLANARLSFPLKLQTTYLNIENSLF